ncbi:hypothetical protein GCM10025870_31510 [Agromyces marinus]|uniref:Uncharacterized protein n=1 Tax=Agromyces marinus TaxID=1389020 RepID=A0ABM8H5I6_9MICO|nr:hypothetical protein GCM10025870_31510 [Agromyces marinus]
MHTMSSLLNIRIEERHSTAFTHAPDGSGQGRRAHLPGMEGVRSEDVRRRGRRGTARSTARFPVVSYDSSVEYDGLPVFARERIWVSQRSTASATVLAS